MKFKPIKNYNRNLRISQKGKQKQAAGVKTKVGKVLKAEGDLSGAYRKEFLVWFLSILVSTLIYLACARLILAFYHPDITAALEYAKQNFNIVYGMFDFEPEPIESILFLSGAFIYFFGLIACYWLFSGIIKKMLAGKALNVYFTAANITGILLVVVIGWLGLIAQNPFADHVQNIHDETGKLNLDFYFIGTFIYDHFLFYFFVVFPLLVLLFFWMSGQSEKKAENFTRITRYFVLIFCTSVIIIVFFISIFRFPYTFQNFFDTNIVYYSVVQVFRGSPMLVDNFKNTYGLYPHFLAPILKITGLSMLSFTTIMAFLLTLCFGMLYYLLVKIVSNPLLVLFGFTSVFFMAYMYVRLILPYDPCFAIWPIRWVFPFMLMVFSYVYYENRNRLIYYGSMALFALGILWNPDFGLLTYMVLIAFFCYLEFDAKPTKVILKNIVLHCITALFIGFASFMMFGALVKIFYGGFPAFAEIFTTLRVHALVGYGMLPMPVGFHPYMLVVIVLVTGILYSARAMVRRRITQRDAVVFVLTISGAGAFEYYVGRSHNWNLCIVFPTVFLLLTIFADDLAGLMKSRKIFTPIFSLILFILSISFFQTVYAFKEITSLMFENENKETMRPFREKMSRSADFIRSRTRENEPVLIFMNNEHQSLMYGLSGTKAILNPGFNELFLKADYKRILDFLIKNDSVKIFFDPESYRFYDKSIPAILSSCYYAESVEQGGDMILFKKKTPGPRQDLFLKESGEVVLHEQFPLGSGKRIRYSMGEKSKFLLGQQFSVQVIFMPQDIPASRYSKYGAIISNINDSSGFMIQQHDTNRTSFLFALKDKGFIIHVSPNPVNYLAFTFNNGVLKGYSNGKFSADLDLGKKYIESNEPLYIGNVNMKGGFFFGDIYEVNISKGIIPDQEIVANWENIQTRFKK